MVVGGTISVEVDIDGGFSNLSVPLIVQPRPAMSWSNSIGGVAGSPGEIDGCFPSGESTVGLTASVQCANPLDANKLFIPRTHDESFFQPGLIQGGPNHGIWFIVSPLIDMDLRTQVSKRYRTDGVKLAVDSTNMATLCQMAYFNTAPRNHLEVNTSCAGVQLGYDHSRYLNFLTFVWLHEGRHLSKALEGARSATGDVHRRLGGLVAFSYQDLRGQAENVFDDASQHVFSTALSSHVEGVTSSHTMYLFRQKSWKDTTRAFPW